MNPKEPPPPPVAPTIRSEYADLTEAIARKALPPETGQRFIRDIRLPGFALRITANGTKSWVVEARMRGEKSAKRRTLGRYPQVNADRARSLAIQELGRYAEGVDRLEDDRVKKAKAVTLGMVFADYLAARDLKPTTVSNYQSVFTAMLDDWRNMPITAITRSMVEQRHKRESLRSKARANYAMRVLRSVFNFAAAKYETAEGGPLIIDNPVKRLNAVAGWNRIERRRRLVRLHQMPAWFAGLDFLRAKPGMAPHVADWFEFMILTGCRRVESLTLVWSSVDLPGRMFHLPDTKNREVHELPLSDRLVEMLTARQAAADPKQPRVFYGYGAPLTCELHWLKTMIAHCDIPFSPHDLRRTFATVAEGLDIQPYTIKRLMNHVVNADVTGGYIQIDVERLRVPMQRITDTILTAAGRKGDLAKVIEFPTAKSA